MPDFVLAKSFLSLDEQRQLVAAVFAIAPGFYVPTTRWGKAMNLRMNCLGHHWSARDYRYHPTRADVDQLPCAPIPDLLQRLARRALVDTHYLDPADVRPYDICIANSYPELTGKLGDHVDNSESPAALAGGYPVLSLSVGAACLFRFGGSQRTDRYETHTLDSGDALLFGRSLRLAFHGVKQILPGTTPPGLPLPEPGRLNLTFRVL